MWTSASPANTTSALHMLRQSGRSALATNARHIPHRVQPHPLQSSHRHVQVCSQHIKFFC